MNQYQVVLPNGDILRIAAEAVRDDDGSLKFTTNGQPVGEITRWIGWSLMAEVEKPGGDK